MRKFFTRFFVLIGILSFISFISLIALGYFAWKNRIQVPETCVLSIDFSKEIQEYTQDMPVFANQDANPCLLSFINALEKASGDDRVKGLVAYIGSPAIGLAQIQEIRNAVHRFRQSGKPAWAYTDSFGEISGGNQGYYLASAFEKIYMQPSGFLGFSGMHMATPFVKNTLSKIGVTPQFDRRKQYKNAVNTFLETEYTDAHRESNVAIMDAYFRQIIHAVAKDRGLGEATVRNYVEKALFIGKEAVRAGLVDDLRYREEIREMIDEKFEKKDPLFSVSAYARAIAGEKAPEATIAVIYGLGAIHRGEGEYSPVYGDYFMGSQTMVKAFQTAVEDEKVKAIVFRVDSPGGSYIGSDTILQETLSAKKAGKPVIVSMGNVAASGGYFVSMGADSIIASPGTLTGSIGVYSGKFVTREMWNKLGITWDEIKSGENADMWSSLSEFTEDQWQTLSDMLDAIYADFTGKVAKHRKLETEKVLEAAKGRVWSGEDAKELGLVDSLEGFSGAIAAARKAASIPDDKAVRYSILPKSKSPFEKIMELVSGKTSVQKGLAAASGIYETALPYLRELERVNAGGKGDASLLAPGSATAPGKGFCP